jgi:hypothetical protein
MGGDNSYSDLPPSADFEAIFPEYLVLKASDLLLVQSGLLGFIQLNGDASVKDWNVEGDFLASQARFVGRQDQFAKLNEELNGALQWDGAGQGEYRILNWTGPSGVGKSALCSHMASELEKARQGGANVAWAHIDLTDGRMLNDPVSTMVELRSQLGARGALSSPLFAYGLTMWSALQYPGADIRARYPELFRASHGEVTDDVLSWVGDLAKEVFDVGNDAIPGLNIFAKYGRRILDHAADLQERKGLEAHIAALDQLYASTDKSGLRKVLPQLLGADLRSSMALRPKKGKLQKLFHGDRISPRFVILVDAYDKALRQGDDDRMEIDCWLEQVAIYAPGAIMALFGRERLQWEQDDRRWAGRMQHLALPPLSIKETESLLEALEVPAGPAHQDIYQVSQGHPRVARLCADIYHAKTDADQVATKDDYEEDAEAALKALVAHLSPEAQKALMILSVPQNGVTEELFAQLVPSASGSPFGWGWKDFIKMSVVRPMGDGKRYRLDDFVSFRLLPHLGKMDMALLRKSSQISLAFYERQLEAPGVKAGDIFAFYSHLDQVDRDTAAAWLDAQVGDFLGRGDWPLVQALLQVKEQLAPASGSELSPSLRKTKNQAQEIHQFHNVIMQKWNDYLGAGLDTFKALRLAVAMELDEISYPAGFARSQVRQGGQDRARILESWARGFLMSCSLPESGKVEGGDRAKWAAVMMVAVYALRHSSSEPSTEISNMLENVRAELEGTELWPLPGWHMEAAIQKARAGKPEDAEALFEQAARGPLELPAYTGDVVLFHRCENLVSSGRTDLVVPLCDEYLGDLSKKGTRITGFIAMMRAKAKLDLEVDDLGMGDTLLAEDLWKQPVGEQSTCVAEGEPCLEELAALRKEIAERGGAQHSM